MIEAIEGKGVHRAKAVCDECGRSETVTCDYERVSSKGWRPNEGQIIRKVEAQKWALVKGALRCPACEAKRKAANPTPKQEAQVIETKPKATAEAPRHPTPAIKRQIIGLLEDAYDDDAKRYRNPADNDKSIAEVIGNGCLWGWVAAIREELFGPDTRNAELEAIRAEVKRLEGVAGNMKGEIVKVEAAVAELRARLDKAA